MFRLPQQLITAWLVTCHRICSQYYSPWVWINDNYLNFYKKEKINNNLIVIKIKIRVIATKDSTDQLLDLLFLCTTYISRCIGYPYTWPVTSQTHHMSAQWGRTGSFTLLFSLIVQTWEGVLRLLCPCRFLIKQRCKPEEWGRSLQAERTSSQPCRQPQWWCL